MVTSRKRGSPSSPPSEAPIHKKIAPEGMLSVTQAKLKYKLTDKDLRGLKCVKHPNPINPGYQPMKLYKEEEIKAKAQTKFGGDEGLDQYKTSLEAAGEDRREKRRAGEAARIEEVYQIMQKRTKLQKLSERVIRNLFFKFVNGERRANAALLRLMSERTEELHNGLMQSGVRGIPEDSELCRRYVEDGMLKGPVSDLKGLETVLLDREFFLRETIFRELFEMAEEEVFKEWPERKVEKFKETHYEEGSRAFKDKEWAKFQKAGGKKGPVCGFSLRKEALRRWLLENDVTVDTIEANAELPLHLTGLASIALS